MPEQNEQEYHTTPEWLTTDYMQDKLQKYYKDTKIIVTNLNVQPAIAQGENYASVMTRIVVKFRDALKNQRTESYIVKTTFEDKDAGAFVFKHYGIYVREMDMYEKVLPKITELLHKTGARDKLFADTIHVDRKQNSIIFEDLTLRDYVTANRVGRLDLDHVKLALCKLAKMHATAAVLNEQTPGLFSENFDRGLFNRHTQANKPALTGTLSALARYIAQNAELKSKYYEKIVAMQDNIMEYGARAFDVNKQHFNTLTHGDYWTTNMMFKYCQSGKPLDVIPIDFQFSTWGSPTIDLQYFFNTSLHEELRLNNQGELLQFYYNILTKTLRFLSYKGHIPCLYDFCLQFESRKFLAVFCAFVFQPLMIYEGSEDASFENFFASTEVGIRFKDSLFENEHVQKYVERLLPIFDQKGLLDVMD